MTTARRRGVFALGVLLALAGMRMLDRLVFFPDRTMPPAPPPGIVERAFRTSDGVTLHAYLAAPPDPVATLVWSHGNAGNIANRAGIALELAARGFAVLAYDYRGYGRSEGSPSEAGVHLDALAAYDHLRAAGVDPSRIVCFGESLGGAVTIRLASERPCAAVVVVATFPAIRDVARAHYGFVGAVMGRRFDVGAAVRRLTVPLLVAHGDADEVVPYALGERLFAAAPQPKRFVRIDGAMHNDVLDRPEVLDAMTDFVRASIGSGPLPRR